MTKLKLVESDQKESKIALIDLLDLLCVAQLATQSPEASQHLYGVLGIAIQKTREILNE